MLTAFIMILVCCCGLWIGLRTSDEPERFYCGGVPIYWWVCNGYVKPTMLGFFRYQIQRQFGAGSGE